MKRIKVTQEELSAMISDFQKHLASNKFQTGKITYERDLMAVPANTPKPTVRFSATAYMKMRNLIQDCYEEVGWHGLVTIDEHEAFVIEDIILYPQVTTGATTTAKEPEYANWLMEQPDDVFFKIRFQGHSHVNFAPNPSGVDNTFYEKILDQMQDNDFFIFMIMNKRDEYNIWIYDYRKNIIFEKADIHIIIELPDKSSIKAWQAQQMFAYVTDTKKALAETKEVTPSTLVAANGTPLNQNGAVPQNPEKIVILNPNRHEPMISGSNRYPNDNDYDEYNHRAYYQSYMEKQYGKK